MLNWAGKKNTVLLFTRSRQALRFHLAFISQIVTAMVIFPNNFAHASCERDG